MRIIAACRVGSGPTAHTLPPRSPRLNGRDFFNAPIWRIESGTVAGRMVPRPSIYTGGISGSYAFFVNFGFGAGVPAHRSVFQLRPFLPQRALIPADSHRLRPAAVETDAIQKFSASHDRSVRFGDRHVSTVLVYRERRCASAARRADRISTGCRACPTAGGNTRRTRALGAGF
jgi:hypothetical protein